MDVGGRPVDIVGLYTLALLVNVCGLLWSAGIALRFRSIQAGPLMQMPVFLLLFFAPVYVPVDLLSGWIEKVAAVNPITYLLEAGRSLLAGDPTEVALAFGGRASRWWRSSPSGAFAACAAPRLPARTSGQPTARVLR